MKDNLLSIGKIRMRAKTLLTLLAATIVLIALVHTVSNTLMLGGFKDLEEAEVTTDMERLRAILDERIEALNTKAKDWAIWDDTYDFVADRNEEYVMANLYPSAAVYLNINLMAFIDQSRQLVYMLFVDLETGETVPVPPGLSELMLESTLGHHDSTESNIAGIAKYGDNVIMVVSQPILTSQGEGPVNGALVFGRLLDQSFVNSLATSAKMELDLTVLSSGTIPRDAGIPSELSVGTPILVQPITDNSIKGYALFVDPFGQPVALLTAQIPRDVYQKGQATVRTFIFW